jgi:hypothetical protein
MHKYDATGNLVDPWQEGFWSPTTILDITRKRRIEDWQDRVGWEEAEAHRKYKADVGSEVHSVISSILQKANLDETVNIDCKPYLDAFCHWLPESPHLSDVQSEVFVRSEKYKFAGTADLVCNLGDEPWVIDFKTGSPQVSHGLQLKAYQQAYYEMTGVRCRMAGLYLGTGTKKGWRWKEYKEPFYVFLAHKQIFEWQLRKNPIKVPTTWVG